MSSDSKNDKWIQIPDTKTPCVIDLGKYAVDDYNKAHKDNLVFKKVIIGWYLEIDYDKTKLRLIIEVVNSKGEVIIYEVVIVVDDKDGKKVKTPISFIPGYIDEVDPWLFWFRIFDINDPHVQKIAKFAVEKHNQDNNDSLVYISTIVCWYRSLSPILKQYKVYLKAKDCLGRVRDYEALVEEEKKLPNAILKLIYFKVIPKKC